MKKALILVLAVMICLVAYYTWSFADGDFTSGNATITDEVESIDINWTSGSVTVTYHDADTVILEETSDRPINGDDRMRWKMDGKTLVVEYNTPVFLRFSSPTKALTVTLPRGKSLKKADIIATSADIHVPELAAEEIALGSTSGGISVKVNAFEQMKINVTSGSVDAELSADPGFTAKVSQTSGDFDSALALTKNGDVWSCGDGSGKLEIGTTSGDVRLTELK